MSGVGNIYANEILFASRIHPETKVNALSSNNWEDFFNNTKKIMRLAIKNNGTTLTNDRFGNANSAINSNGSGQFVTVVHQTNGSLDPGNGSFSASGWIRSSNSATANPILEKKNFNGYALFMSIAGEMKLYVEDQNSNLNEVVSPSSNYNDGQWHHVVGIRDVNVDSIFLWVDGALIATKKDLTISAVECTEPLYFGEWGGTPNDLDGDIDDIGYWNRALTACEVQDLYNAELNSVINSATQMGAQLTADQDNATYQWIDCDNNNSPISGETNQSYTPRVTGNIAVVVTLKGCTSVSECVLVDFTGVDELLKPTTKKLVKIVNLLGQEVEYTPNTVLIYQYSDGTSEKVFTIED